MTSPSESSQPEHTPMPPSGLDTHGVDESSALRRIASELWNQRTEELLDIWRAASPETSPHIDPQLRHDLRYELEKLGKSADQEVVFNVLKEVARDCAVRPDTIVLATSMLNRFCELSPNPSQLERVKQLVLVPEGDKGSREELIIRHARLSFLCSGGRLNNIACESYVGLIERGAVILEQSTLSHHGCLGLVEVMGALAQSRGSFRGVRAIREVFEAASSDSEIALLTTILGAGISVNDIPKGLAQAASVIVAKAMQDHTIKDALLPAVADQLRNGASVRDLLETFGRLHDSWVTKSERRHGLQKYTALVDTLRPHRASLHLVSRSHVDQFAGANEQLYTEALVAHVQSVEALTRLAQDTNRFDRADLQALQSIVALYPNPAMTKVFKTVLENINRRVDNPHQVLAHLCSLAVTHELRPSQWTDISAMLTRQIPKGRAFDGVIAAIVDVARYAEETNRKTDLWTDFSVLSESLGEEIPDLSFLTKEALVSHLKDPSERNYRHLVALLNCADVAADHFNGDCKTPSELMTRLLRKDGLAECLVKAVEHHRKLGLDDEGLFEAYPTLDRGLPALGVSLLHQVVNYQMFHGFPLGEVFRNFSELALHASSEKGSEDMWSGAQSAIEKLGARKVPLDFFGVTIAREILASNSDSVVLDRAEETLRLLHDLSPHRRPGPDGGSGRRLSAEEERRSLNLLAAAADGGVRSATARVLAKLSQSDDSSHEKLSCAEVAQLCSVPEHMSEQAWIAIGRSIELYRERGYSLRRLCKSVFDLNDEIMGDESFVKETWRSITELIMALQDAPLPSGERGLPYDLLSRPFIERYMKSGDEPAELLIHFLSGMTQFNEKLRGAAQPGAAGAKVSQENTEVLRKSLNDITDQGFGLTDNPAMVHKLKLILAEGDINSLQDFFSALRDLKMHALTDIMRNASDESRKKWASDLMAREFNMGGPPYVQGTEEAKRHFNETMQVVDRALRDSKGFGGMALDTRGLPRSERFDPVPPMLVRFALGSAKASYIVNSSDNSRFPGKGFFIAGIDAHKVFATDPRWRARGKSSPHWRWTEGRGLFASSYFHNFNMKDFEKCGYLQLRGLQAVVPPSDRRYVLDGVPYSYLVYNRHFAPYPQAALGVPTIVIHELLGNSLIDTNDFRGFESSRTDLSKVDFSYQALLAACQRRGLNLLDLTYGSVIGGGLCNVYLPRSLPHYEWERSAGASSGWTDSWGHIHKSFRLGQNSSMNRTLDEQLSYARSLHYDVRDVFRSLQDYLSGFRFALSFYKMGSTLVRDSDFREADEEIEADEQGDQSDERQEGNGEQEERGAEEQERRVHEYRYRMLQESYRWHHGGREQRWQFEQFPELHFAWVLDPNSLPPQAQRKFHLDLATMVLKTKEGTFQLPKDSDGTGDEERAIWAEQVVPHFERDSTGWEPRFLMRNGAFSIYE
ncbi:MAG: hypothetical protein RL326_289 [Pseudomonadota bacterium]